MKHCISCLIYYVKLHKKFGAVGFVSKLNINTEVASAIRPKKTLSFRVWLHSTTTYRCHKICRLTVSLVSRCNRKIVMFTPPALKWYVTSNTHNPYWKSFHLENLGHLATFHPFLTAFPSSWFRISHFLPFAGINKTSSKHHMFTWYSTKQPPLGLDKFCRQNFEQKKRFLRRAFCWQNKAFSSRIWAE